MYRWPKRAGENFDPRGRLRPAPASIAAHLHTGGNDPSRPSRLRDRGPGGRLASGLPLRAGIARVDARFQAAVEVGRLPLRGAHHLVRQLGPRTCEGRWLGPAEVLGFFRNAIGARLPQGASRLRANPAFPKRLAERRPSAPGGFSVRLAADRSRGGFG